MSGVGLDRIGYKVQIASDVLPRRYASPDLIAHGGMGEVYRATDTALERTVAVKVLADQYASGRRVRGSGARRSPPHASPLRPTS